LETEKRIPNLFKWVVAISIAQTKLVYSKIKVPILVMHLILIKDMNTFSKEAMIKDTVLDIEDIKELE
jgi:hypothetical protein